MRMPLDRLLAPRSVAVVGGGVWAENVITELGRIGFAGEVWPVHPRRRDLGGRLALARLEDLPGVPDATFLAINREASVEAVAVLAAMGAGGAVCFASGWAEARAELTDGPGLQARLVSAAGDMPVLGPNCYGFVNALDGVALWPDQHGLVPVESGVAILTQSSNIALTLTMQARGLPIAAVIACGNQAVLRQADLALHLVADPRVTAIGLHMEAPGDLRALERLAAGARAAGKPVVALRTGLSEKGRAAGLSHTAALAGSAAGAEALLARLGIARVDSVAGLVEALKLAHGAGPLTGGAISAISSSGGEAGLMADALAARGLALPALTSAQQARLRAALGPRVALANPLDYHTYIWGDVPAMAATFAAMLPAHVDLGLLVVDFPRADRCDPAGWLPVIEAASRAVADGAAPLALLSTLPEGMPEGIAAEALARGLVPLCGQAEAVEAVAALACVAGVEPSAPLLLPGRGEGAVTTLAEAEAKAALAGFGLAVPRSARAETPAEAAAAADALGLPVALKGAGAAHKTEAGTVRLGLSDAAAVEHVARAIPAERFLVEEMVTGAVAELLVGIRRDPAHGFVLTLAAGGVQAEMLEDAGHLLLPATDEQIAAALGRLRVAKLLAGWRGAPAADRGAIVAAVQAVAGYATAHADRLEEAEVNPLICTPDRAVAADALIRLREAP